MPKVTTTGRAIDALGGNQPVATMCMVTHKAVSNWRKSGVFPAATYLLLRSELEHRKITAPDSLWAMRAVSRKSA